MKVSPRRDLQMREAVDVLPERQLAVSGSLRARSAAAGKQVRCEAPPVLYFDDGKISCPSKTNAK